MYNLGHRSQNEFDTVSTAVGPQLTVGTLDERNVGRLEGASTFTVEGFDGVGLRFEIVDDGLPPRYVIFQRRENALAIVEHTLPAYVPVTEYFHRYVKGDDLQLFAQRIVDDLILHARRRGILRGLNDRYMVEVDDVQQLVRVGLADGSTVNLECQGDVVVKAALIFSQGTKWEHGLCGPLANVGRKLDILSEKMRARR